MSKSKKQKEKDKKCHFCTMKPWTQFEYNLRLGTEEKKYVQTCRPHFEILCDMTYNNSTKLHHIPAGQREFISIRRLESQLNVSNAIQFK